MTRPGWIAAAVAVLAVTAGIATITPAIDSDTTWAILAAEQRLRGLPNTLQQMIVADPDDLARDRPQSIGWAAPGHQEAFYLLRRAGLSFGAALKTMIVACWLAGIVGWGLYFWIAAPNRRIAPWLIALFAFFRMSHYHAFVFFGGDLLLWAIFPFVVLANIRAIRAAEDGAGRGWALAAGAASAVLVIFKYSAVFLTAAIGLAWLWSLWSRELRWSRAWAWTAGAAAGTAFSLAAGIGALLSTTTPASAQCGVALAPVLAWGAAGSLMGLSDITALVDSFLRRTGQVGASDPLIAAMTAALACVLLVWFVASRQTVAASVASSDATSRLALRLTALTMAAVSAGLIVLMLRGGCISMESRHQQYGGFMALPFLAAWFAAQIKQPKAATRALTVVCAFLFVAVPFLYGAGAFVDKVFVRMPSLRSAISPAGVRITWLGGGSGVSAFYREVSALPEMNDSLLAVSAPDMGILFPQARVLILPGGDAKLPWMQAKQAVRDLRGRPRGPVLLIPQLVAPDDANFVRQRQAFRDIRAWTPIVFASEPHIRAWSGR
jgi:hypothetical protein